MFYKKLTGIDVGHRVTVDVHGDDVSDQVRAKERTEEFRPEPGGPFVRLHEQACVVVVDPIGTVRRTVHGEMIHAGELSDRMRGGADTRVPFGLVPAVFVRIRVEIGERVREQHWREQHREVIEDPIA